MFLSYTRHMIRPIRSIRLIRGRKSCGVLPSRQMLRVVSYKPRALPPVTQGSAFQAPERMWGIIRGRILSRGQVFIYVYRLAMDARTRKGDGVGG